MRRFVVLRSSDPVVHEMDGQFCIAAKEVRGLCFIQRDLSLQRRRRTRIPTVRRQA